MKGKIMKQLIIGTIILLGVIVAQSQDVRVLASSPHSSDQFGFTVDICGNYCIVGAPNIDLYATTEESAYIYHLNGGSWTLIKKLVDPENDGYDDFGQAVAISGDYCAVGVPDKSFGGSGEGCVFVFARNQGGENNWGMVKKVYAFDQDNGDYFGFAVALSGDYLIVGAYQDDGGGSAYIFYRNQGGTDNWGFVKKLTPSISDNIQEYGRDVDIYNDIAVVGARNCNSEGRAYVYYRNQGGADNWGEVKALIGNDTHAGDYFGHSVTVWGDYIAVGAESWDDGDGDNIGSAYVFYRNQGGADNWGQVNQFFPEYLDGYNRYGSSVAMYNQFLVVGAPRERIVDLGQIGFIYSYQLQNNNTWAFKKKHNSGTDSNDRYAYDVAITQTYAVAGVPYDDVYPDSADVGSAYIMDNAAVLGLVEDASLPVELSSFTARAENGKVVLRWCVQSELNNDAFILERSTDSLHFTKLAEVKGRGNSSSRHVYSYEDRAVINGRTYFYRLADRDFTGTLTYHSVIKATPMANNVRAEHVVVKNFRLYPPFPNPFNPETSIRFDVPSVRQAEYRINIAIYNTRGQKIAELYNGLIAGGAFKLRWDGKNSFGRNVPSGLYFVVLRAPSFYDSQKLMLIR